MYSYSTRILSAYLQVWTLLEIITQPDNATMNFCLPVSTEPLRLFLLLLFSSLHRICYKTSPLSSKLWIFPLWWHSCLLFLEQMNHQLRAPWIYKSMKTIYIDLYYKGNTDFYTIVFHSKYLKKTVDLCSYGVRCSVFPRADYLRIKYVVNHYSIGEYILLYSDQERKSETVHIH